MGGSKVGAVGRCVHGAQHNYSLRRDVQPREKTRYESLSMKSLLVEVHLMSVMGDEEEHGQTTSMILKAKTVGMEPNTTDLARNGTVICRRKFDNKLVETQGNDTD